jgi:hypothetical protein
MHELFELRKSCAGTEGPASDYAQTLLGHESRLCAKYSINLRRSKFLELFLE